MVGTPCVSGYFLGPTISGLSNIDLFIFELSGKSVFRNIKFDNCNELTALWVLILMVEILVFSCNLSNNWLCFVF